MADTQEMPAEQLARIFLKNDAAGAPLTVPADGSGDGNAFVFIGNTAQTSQFDAQFENVAAITGACFNRAASQNVSGATANIADCDATGAKTFYGQFINGFTNGYTAAGLVSTLDIEAPNAASGCNTDWTGGAVTAASTRWTMIDLVGWRDCNDNVGKVRANIARSISAADPQTGPQFGGANPGDNTFSATLTLKSNSGWGAGPGGLFPIFTDLAGAVPNANPVSIGFDMDVTALYTELIKLCACDSAVRGVPITAALIVANPGLDTALITG